MHIRSRTAPIRICDNGGWTDTWFARHGRVFNIAVRPLVGVRIDVYPRGSRDAHVVIDARNYGTRYAPDLERVRVGTAPAARGRVPRDRATRRRRHRSDHRVEGAGWRVDGHLRCGARGAARRARSPGRAGTATAHAIAGAAHAVETVHLRRQCGIQDQLCSAYGGVNFIEMSEYPRAIVSQLLAARSAAS